MKTKRANFRNVGLLTLFLIAGTWIAFTFSQPRAGGHSLNYWLDYGWHPSTGLFDPDAEVALRKIGMETLIVASLNETPAFTRKVQTIFHDVIQINSGTALLSRRLHAARAVDQIFPDQREEIFLTYLNALDGNQERSLLAYSFLADMKNIPMNLALQELANPKRNQGMLLNILQSRTSIPVFNEFRLLVSDVPEARWKGIGRLEGAMNDPLVFAAVSEMLKDTDSDVRKAALTALAKTGLPLSVREKVKEGLSDEDEKVRSLAADLLKEKPSEWE